MREDMAKVLVERPRRIDGSKQRCRDGSRAAHPAVGLKRAAQEAGGFKRLNENLAPLRRFLERQVGRPWNKVYSEIAERLKVTSTVQQHVRDHLKDFVQLNPNEDVRTYSWSERRWFQALYVDPRDGLLKETAKLPWAKALAQRPRPTLEIDALEIGAGLRLHRIDGHWFEVRTAQLPEPKYRAVTRLEAVPGAPHQAPREHVIRQLVTPAVYDVVTGKAVCAGPEQDDPRSWAIYRKAQPDRWFAISKRQLSRRELRRHALSNHQAS